jgi:ABC-type glycerol-3-phosphate transport system permease component
VRSACSRKVTRRDSPGPSGTRAKPARYRAGRTYSQDTASVFAFTALSMLPALAFFLLAQRRIVSGLSGLSGSMTG